MRVPEYARAQRSEASIQMQVAGWLDKYLAPPAMFTAFPAGGGGYDRGAKLKSMGLKAGVPDLVIFWRDQVYFIEIKTATGRASDRQKEMWETIALALPSCRISECRSLEDVKEAVRMFGLPLKSISKNNERMQLALDASFKPNETL